MSKVGIVNYRLGNIYSIYQAIARFGYDPVMVEEEAHFAKVSHVILPGVGAFSRAMDNLEAQGLREGLSKFVRSGKPLMGICLGMQVLFSESEEFGHHAGLALIPGRVRKIACVAAGSAKQKVPNIGWRDISFPAQGQTTHRAFFPPEASDYYFVHSFCVCPEDERLVVATSQFGETSFCAAVGHDNIFATQFHPENSGPQGLKILQAWLAAGS